MKEAFWTTAYKGGWIHGHNEVYVPQLKLSATVRERAEATLAKLEN